MQVEYAKWYNAVDPNDRDSADYSIMIRTMRYYIHIFCWVLDCVIHCEYQVVCFLATYGIENLQWKRYLKQGRRQEFQIDLAIELMNHGLGLDWDDRDERPIYMGNRDFVPCDCKKTHVLFRRPDRDNLGPPGKKNKRSYFTTNVAVSSSRRDVPTYVLIWG